MYLLQMTKECSCETFFLQFTHVRVVLSFLEWQIWHFYFFLGDLELDAEISILESLDALSHLAEFIAS